MKTLSKTTKTLIVLACITVIIAMVFVAVRDNLAIVVQDYVSAFCVQNGISPVPNIANLIDDSVIVTVNADGSLTATQAP